MNVKKNVMEQISISHIMTTDVITVGEDTLGTEIRDIFDAHHIHHLPVVDAEGRVVGIISRLDYNLLLDQFTRFALKRAEKANNQFLGALIARDVMQDKVCTIRREDPVEEASRIFLENLFHCLPVVDKGKLVGIVTTHDVLRYLHDKDEQLRLQSSK